jgi:hypothetical protein
VTNTTAPPTISASRLKMVAKCERQYAGAYLFGLKQASTPALEKGTALHSAAEHYQETGEIEHPESVVGTLLAAGTHLITMCGDLLVEYEHQGELPDGTPYLAYFDGHSETAARELGTVIVQDLKTTGSAARALTAETLLKDEQAMLYAWILLCSVHRFRKDESSPWQVWDPATRFARSARLRWIYFLTQGSPRAWEATVHVTPVMADAYMQGTIMPLVRRIRAIHDWRALNPGATLEDYERNLEACDGIGRWCGVGERDACEMGVPGTSAERLIQIRTKPNTQESERTQMTDPNDRMAALRAKYASKTAPAATPVVVAAPVADPETYAAHARFTEPTADPKEATQDTNPEPQPAPIASQPAVSSVPETTGPSLAGDPTSAPVRTRKPRTPAPAAPPEGAAGVNPPEAVEALAKMNAEIKQDSKDDTVADVLQGAALQSALEQFQFPQLTLPEALTLVRSLLPPGTSVTVQGVY